MKKVPRYHRRRAHSFFRTKNGGEGVISRVADVGVAEFLLSSEGRQGAQAQSNVVLMGASNRGFWKVGLLDV